MPPSERRRRLVWLIAIRAIISTLLLGASLIVQINSPGAVPLRPFYFLISLSYALTVVNALTLRWTDRHRWLVDAHLVSDVVVVSGFIAVTGGVTSFFALLYVLPIIAASTLQGRRGGLVIGALSSAIYGALVVLQYWTSLPFLAGGLGQAEVVLPPPRVAQYTVGINIFAFLAVAALAGSLAESLRLAGASLARASKEIEDLQAFSQDIIDSLTSGLMTTDVSGRILSLNTAAEQITARSPAEVIDRNVSDVLQLPDEVTRALASDLGGERSRRADFVYHTGDGRRIDLGLAVAHLIRPGGKAGFLLTFQDVTGIRRLERDARTKLRLAAVGEMAAGIAHEIRNPLASMAGSVQVLRDELQLDEEQAQLMDIVLRESTRLNETIRGFLAYARPQRTGVARLDLGKTVSDTALLLRNSADVKPDHRVDVETPDEPLWYEADESQVRQILWNLATNGLRAMPGGGRLRLAAFADATAQGVGPAAPRVAVLEVEDEGVGIPPEELDGIFQPFHGTFARGSGLGLAIVHRIVEDYGGEIQVTSSVGKGTKFAVRLGGVTALSNAMAEPRR
jgi:two-component system sensor histidine kinase PilS (NtrC family)